MSDKIKVYKAFDKDWKCRDFQYHVGETYKHDGPAKLCDSGFHACEYPLDIFNYYPPTGQIAECELSDLDATTSNDSKRAGSTITIKASISIPALISAAIEYTVSRCKPSDKAHSDIERSAASNTGDRSAASNTGDRSAASNTGDRSAASNTGDRSAASNTGDYSAASNTGDYSAASNTGDRSAASNTGENGVAAVFGFESKAVAGESGIIIVAWMDGDRKRVTVGYTGENGIESGKWYRADGSGKLIETK